jgi:hypothetical protein
MVVGDDGNYPLEMLIKFKVGLSSNLRGPYYSAFGFNP